MFDEIGKLSAQQVAVLDIIFRQDWPDLSLCLVVYYKTRLTNSYFVLYFRHARHNNIPFGGALILGTFDAAQLGAIEVRKNPF